MSSARTKTAAMVIAMLSLGLPAGATPPASNPKRALDLPVEFEFVAVPLCDIAAYVSDFCMVKVELGPAVAPKAPVTYRGKGRLDDQLKRLLATVGLAYVVIGDRIVIR